MGNMFSAQAHVINICTNRGNVNTASEYTSISVTSLMWNKSICLRALFGTTTMKLLYTRFLLRF